MSGQHFAVDCEESLAKIRDLGSSNGTFVNGARVNEAVLNEADTVVTGATTFTVRFERTRAGENLGQKTIGVATMSTASYPGLGRVDQTTLGAPIKTEPSTDAWPGFTRPQAVLLSTLFRDSDFVYVVLDSYRENRVPAYLDASREQYASLFDDQRAMEMSRVAPYLALVPARSRLVDVLVKDGWGKGWGMYISCPGPFEIVRAHLQNLYFAQTRDGRPFFNRFFDPRVLRATMPAMTPGEVTAFFGPFKRILVEGEKPEVAIEFTDTMRGIKQEAVVLI
jgi:pSer/pThr/pTyr-binding forkhead associated (FHA) protein